MPKKEQEALFHEKNPIIQRLSIVSSLVIGLVFSIFILKIFYGSPLRTRVEDKLYDSRMRLAPNFQILDDLVLIAIDDKYLKTLDESSVNSSVSYGELAHLAEDLEKTDAKSIALILPSQIYTYEDPRIEALTTVVKRDKRFALGVFEVSQKSGDALGVPNTLKPIRDQIYKADLTRDFRREIVRQAVVHRQGEIPYLIRHLAEQLNPKIAGQLDQLMGAFSNPEGELKLRPKYSNPSRIPTVSMSDWLHGDGRDKLRSHLAGKVVIVGYTAYRPATFKSAEATFVNTPWQEEGRDVTKGIPLVSATALIAHSLSREDWLKEAGIGLNLLQSIVIALFSLRVWGGAWGVLRRGRFSIGFAVFLYLFGWFLLLVLHGFLFSFFDLYVPLADAALASVFMTTLGALNRLRHEGRLQAALEAKTLADQEVAFVQDRFLNTFADELAFLNQNLRTSLLKINDSKRVSHHNDVPKYTSIFGKALESCEELDDYLNGIKHFSRLEATVGKGVLTAQQLSKTHQRVFIHELILKVLSQFEARIREKNIELIYPQESGAIAFTDRPIAAQILYNLVSNAIKYSPQGGKVEIEARQNHRECWISVKDQGPGIDPHVHQKIFEKFYRVKNDHVYKIKGHGLGLYLSQYFAKLIRAKIRVESKLGEGATFYLILPAEKASH